MATANGLDTSDEEAMNELYTYVLMMREVMTPLGTLAIAPDVEPALVVSEIRDEFLGETAEPVQSECRARAGHSP